MKSDIIDMPKFPGYRIDTNGDVWSCWNNGGIKTQNYKKHIGVLDKNGYKIYLIKNNKKIKKGYRAHRLIADHFISNPLNKPFVCHNDSNPQNNKLSNLRWDDGKGNMKDRKSRGLYGLNFGEKNGSAKLSKEEVVLIKMLKRDSLLSNVRVGKIFNISRTSIYNIVNSKNWSYVKV